MKKKVRTLENYPNTNSSTFLLDTANSIDINHAEGVGGESQNNDPSIMEKLENIHKKKKATNKENKFHNGLKYAPPSQRNHSSIYE